MMRRGGGGGGGGNASTAAPRSGDSFSSSTNTSIHSVHSSSGGSKGGGGSSSRGLVHRKRRKQQQGAGTNKRSQSWSLVLQALLLLVALLSVLDVCLWLRHVWHIRTRKSARRDALHSSTLSFETSKEHDNTPEEHAQDQRLPPKLVKGDGDDLIDEAYDHYLDADRQPIYEILRQARIDPQSLSNEQKQRLPTWSTVQRLYGDSPKIYGLETCERFRNTTEPSLTFLAMAGFFNSGTNLLASLMIRNCKIDERIKKYGEKQRGIRWQVKWGKHTPPRYRNQHVTSTDKDVPLQYTLPLITIRDPYNWMQSMCRHPYEVHWNHDTNNCPHVWNERNGRTSHVQVVYPDFDTQHTSLPALWNDWYNEYMMPTNTTNSNDNDDYPRVIVRMEDLIFYGKNVTETLCACGGGTPRQARFQHIQNSAKLGTAQHGNDKTSLLEAMIRYGTDEHRLDGMTKKDLEVTRDILDSNLMTIFNYSYA